MSTGYAVEAEAEVYVERSRPKKKAKKSNFITRWLWNGLRNAAEAEKEQAEEVSLKERAMLSKAAVIGSSNELNSDPMRFSIYHANGGFVVETRTPSRGRNQNTIGPDSTTKLHIIHKDADLGQELAKIITLEGLRA